MAVGPLLDKVTFNLTVSFEPFQKVLRNDYHRMHPTDISALRSPAMNDYYSNLSFSNELVSMYVDVITNLSAGALRPLLQGSAHSDILTSVVWPELASRLLKSDLQGIFFPGNPDQYFQNYCATMMFLSRFSYFYHDLLHAKQFQKTKLYQQLMRKWQLPLYFQLRDQEISSVVAASLRRVDANVTSDEHSTATVELTISKHLIQAIRKCWAEDVYLPLLTDRFLPAEHGNDSAIRNPAEANYLQRHACKASTTW